MAHHYDEEKVTVEGNVKVSVLPHPDAEDPPALERQNAERPTEEPVIEQPEQPAPRVTFEEFLRSVTPEEPPCCPVMPEADPSIRELSYALFASFLLGAVTAGALAFFSRRTYTDD